MRVQMCERWLQVNDSVIVLNDTKYEGMTSRTPIVYPRLTTVKGVCVRKLVRVCALLTVVRLQREIVFSVQYIYVVHCKGCLSFLGIY